MVSMLISHNKNHLLVKQRAFLIVLGVMFGNLSAMLFLIVSACKRLY